MRRSSYLLAEEPAVDLAALRVMANELEPYLIDDTLYRTVTIQQRDGNLNLQMTGADLLTRLHRLHGEYALLQLAEQREFVMLQETVTATITALQGRFRQRLAREIKARLNSLRWFLDDCAENPVRCHIEFPFEMRNRQRIEEALKMVGAELDETIAAMLLDVDTQIRRVALPAPFLWAERLQPIFPADPYWYLYRRPPLMD